MYIRVLKLCVFTVCLACGGASMLSAQYRIGTGKVRALYNNHCAACHGKDLSMGLPGLIPGGEWKHIGKDNSFAEYVRQGDADVGMPPFERILRKEEIRSLKIFFEEIKRQNELGQRAIESDAPDSYGNYVSDKHSFKIETVVEGLATPWSLAFLPNEGFLVTEKSGNLRKYKDGKLSQPIEGIPEVWHHGQGGLLEVALHPDFAENSWVYLAYTESSTNESGDRVGMTAICRGKISGNQWKQNETVFVVPDDYHLPSGVHFGTRLAFKDDYLFFSIGDRGERPMAQDLRVPNGKIHRIKLDGTVPTDNPFSNNPGAYPTLWTLGNRNPQGLDFHPATGQLWSSEHGPRGGDEINLIKAGENYGWPEVSHGMHYSGEPLTEKTSAPGMVDPIWYWTPSIAVCGIDFYEGKLFPKWQNDLFAGGLASNELHRLRIVDGKIVEDEVVLRGIGRIRDIASGPEGALYLVLNGPDRIVRLLPSE